MAKYRDPKVTTSTDRSSGGMGRWIAIAAAILILLLLLGWWWSGDDETVVVVPADEAAEGTEPVPPAETEPVPAEPVQQ